MNLSYLSATQEITRLPYLPSFDSSFESRTYLTIIRQRRSELVNIHLDFASGNIRTLGKTKLTVSLGTIHQGGRTCVSISFFSKTLDPLVAKNGNMQVSNTNFEFYDSLADECVVTTATWININRPWNRFCLFAENLVIRFFLSFACNKLVTIFTS